MDQPTVFVFAFPRFESHRSSGSAPKVSNESVPLCVGRYADGVRNAHVGSLAETIGLGVEPACVHGLGVSIAHAFARTRPKCFSAVLGAEVAAKKLLCPVALHLQTSITCLRKKTNATCRSNTTVTLKTPTVLVMSRMYHAQFDFCFFVSVSCRMAAPISFCLPRTRAPHPLFG